MYLVSVPYALCSMLGGSGGGGHRAGGGSDEGRSGRKGEWNLFLPSGNFSSGGKTKAGRLTLRKGLGAGTGAASQALGILRPSLCPVGLTKSQKRWC